MVKEKRILIYFIGWLFLGFIISLVGISKTYAATTSTYENIGYLNDVTVLYSLADDPPHPVEIPRGGTYQLYNVSKMIIQIDNYTFNGGTTYSIELYLPQTTLNNNFYSVFDQNSDSCSIGATDSSGSKYPNFKFNCSNNTKSLTLTIYNTDSSYILNSGIFQWDYIYLRKQVTTTDTSILENQQSQIIDQNKQIIQGQDEIKDTIKDELNNCRDSYNLLDPSKMSGSSTINGLTYTNNGDGTFNIVGTATSNTSITLYSSSFLNNILSLDKYYGLYSSIPYNLKTFNISLRYNTIESTKFITPNNSPLLLNDYNISGPLNLYVPSGTTIEEYNVKIMVYSNSSKIDFYESYGKQICSNKLDETNSQLGDLNNSLNNSNTNDATNDASNFFSNFTTDTFGLTSIITAPLNLIKSITSTSCSSLNLPLPYLENKYLELPCMTSIYSQYFGSFFNIYQIITFGIVAYWVIVRIFNQVKDFKNPEHDEIEVLDL